MLLMHVGCSCRLDGLGGPDSIPGLVDLLAFASTCQGASDEEVCVHACAVCSAFNHSNGVSIHQQGPITSHGLDRHCSLHVAEDAAQLTQAILAQVSIQSAPASIALF